MRIFGVMVLFCLFFAMGVVHASTGAEGTVIANEIHPKADIRVMTKGVVCSFCAQGLKKSFRDASGIESVVFDASFMFMDIYLKKGQDITDEEISNRVINAGYLVEKIIRE
jgi:hypothetical protein